MIHQSASAFCLALESTDQQSRHLAMQPLALNKWQKLTLTQCHTVKMWKTPLQLGLCCCKLFKILWVHHCISILTAPYTHRQQPNFLQHLIQSVKLNSTSHYLVTPDNGEVVRTTFTTSASWQDATRLNCWSWHRTGISGENVLSSGLTIMARLDRKRKGEKFNWATWCSRRHDSLQHSVWRRRWYMTGGWLSNTAISSQELTDIHSTAVALQTVQSFARFWYITYKDNINSVEVNQTAEYLGQRSCNSKLTVCTHRNTSTYTTNCSTMTTKLLMLLPYKKNRARQSRLQLQSLHLMMQWK